jgi:glycine oxidase
MARVRREEPAVQGRFRCGFAFPNEAQVDNVRVMSALSAACRKAGVTLLERTPVRRVIIRHGRVHGVETGDRVLRGSIVVNCLGSWANLGGTFPIRLPVEPVRGQILVFDAPRRLMRRSIISARAYMVQRRDGHVLVGSTIERAGFEKTLTLEGIETILAGLRRMTLVLDRAPFLDAWAGLRPATPDGLPILGPTGIDGLYVATGHFRHGILLAPVTASLMADAMLERPARAALAPFAPDRFSPP